MDCDKYISSLLPELYLKYQLAFKTTKEMCEEYKDLDKYKEFLSISLKFITAETPYFYFEPFIIEKITEVTNKYRFDYNKEPGLNDIINKIIYRSNGIKANMENFEYITPLLNNYLIYQQDARDIDFEDSYALLAAIAKDYEVLQGLITGNLESIHNEYFLTSTNYFINFHPEIYKNQAIRDLTKRHLQTMEDEYRTSTSIMKNYTYSTQKVFKKKLLKEEY